jgi:hypothetical protein
MANTLSQASKPAPALLFYSFDQVAIHNPQYQQDCDLVALGAIGLFQDKPGNICFVFKDPNG